MKEEARPHTRDARECTVTDGEEERRRRDDGEREAKWAPEGGGERERGRGEKWI
jgi:hypothetical protein